jgi:integrase
MQNGQLIKGNKSWFVKFYQNDQRTTRKIGTFDEYPTERDITPVLQRFMADINTDGGRQRFVPNSRVTLRDFVTTKYFPDAEKELRGSTLRGYRAIWNNYIDPRVGKMRLSDVRTFELQEAMDDITTSTELKKASLFRVKTFMSAVFGEAIRCGLRGRDNTNPVSEVKVRGRKNERKGETFAYSLEDIKTILGALVEPSRVLLAVAAYTGLRRGEIVGLKWEDYDGKVIWVRRNICFGQRGEMSVELPKTESSEAPVPVIAPLRKILDAWKAKATIIEDCWIFQAGFTRKKDHPDTLLDAAKLTPASPQNVLRDVIAPALEKAGIEWHGFHAFRRGLATNLRALGVDDLTIMEILRHSDVAVTRASYIKRIDEKSVEAMDRLEAGIRKSARKGVKSVKAVRERVQRATVN